MVLVKFKTTHNQLLTHVQEGDHQGTLGPFDCGIPCPNTVILVLTLLIQEHILQRLLNILEIEGDPIRLRQHLVNQVLLQGDIVLLIL
jgi:hypothetical protein